MNKTLNISPLVPFIQIPTLFPSCWWIYDFLLITFENESLLEKGKKKLLYARLCWSIIYLKKLVKIPHEKLEEMVGI